LKNIDQCTPEGGKIYALSSNYSLYLALDPIAGSMPCWLVYSSNATITGERQQHRDISRP
jgi:hypothetical protein